MRPILEGKNAGVIGEVASGQPGLVTTRTRLGGQQIVDMLIGEQLSRLG